MRATIALASMLAITMLLAGCGEDPKPAPTVAQSADRPAPDAARKPPPPTEKSGKSEQNAQGGQQIDPKLVPPEAIAAAVFFPKRSLSLPAIAKLDLKDFLAKAADNLGFNLADTDEMVVLMLSNRTGKPADLRDISTAMVVRLSRPYEPAELARGIMHPYAYTPEEPYTAEKAEFVGKSYFRPAKTASGYQAKDPCAYLVDDKTFVVGYEAAVKAVMAGKGEKTPLVERLGQVDPADDLSLVVVNSDSLRKVMAEGLATAPPLFKPFANLTDVVATTARIKLSPEISIRLVSDAKDEDAAKKLVDLVAQQQKMLQGMLAGLRSASGPNPPEPLAYALANGDRVVAGLTPKLEGSRVTIEIGGLGTIDEWAAKVLAPAIASANAAAKRAASANTLKQLALAMHNFAAAFGKLPPSAIYSKDGKALLSWRVKLLPYLDEYDLYKKFHLDEPWDSPNNKPLAALMPKVFQHPGDPPNAEGKTRYVVAIGKGTVFEGSHGMAFADITDGTSNTLLIVEVGPDKAVTWTAPDDVAFDPAKPRDGLGKIGEEGFWAAFADGSVHVIQKTVADETLRRLFIRNDGQPIDETKF